MYFEHLIVINEFGEYSWLMYVHGQSDVATQVPCRLVTHEWIYETIWRGSSYIRLRDPAAWTTTNICVLGKIIARVVIAAGIASRDFWQVDLVLRTYGLLAIDDSSTIKDAIDAETRNVKGYMVRQCL